MNKMNKIKLSLIALGALVLSPSVALGLDFGKPGGNITSVQGLVNNILTPIWEVFIGLAVIMIIVAGITFLTASGDPEKIGKARTALIWGVVGIAVGILAFSITAIVKQAL